MIGKPQPVPRCQHIKVNGVQCGSPALKQESFCFFHNRWREQSIDLKRGQPMHEIVSMNFPVLEDANSIQVALMQVMRLVLARQLDDRTAGLLLYGLQTASCNLKHATFEPAEMKKVITDPQAVTSSVLQPEAVNPDQLDNEFIIEGYEIERARLQEERLRKQASALSGTPMSQSEELPQQLKVHNDPFEDLEEDVETKKRFAQGQQFKEDGSPIGLADLLPGGRRGAMRMLGSIQAENRAQREQQLEAVT